MLSIIVCIKQVPDMHGAIFDPQTCVINRDCAINIMNPDDLHALEMALSLKDQFGADITVITMGPPQAADVLYDAYALGADRCVLITDPRFAGSDSLVTSRVLSRALSQLGRFDIIITGFEAIDGNTAHVGFQLSEFLHIPLITQIHKIQLERDYAMIERLYGHEYQKIKVSLPLLLSINKNTNNVRFPRLADIKTSTDKQLEIMTMDDIGGTENEYGIAGSPTVVIETKLFSHKREHEALAGSVNEEVDQLIHKMKMHNILRY